MLYAALLFMLGAAIWAGTSTRSEARLQPYYVITGDAFGRVKPKVLFLLDTSGSMGEKTEASNDECEWDECEDASFLGQAETSRIYTARRAINDVVAGASDSARFSLMTFEQFGPNTSDPGKCDEGGEMVRFVWVDEFAGGQNINAREDGGGPYQGSWRICSTDEKRNYPYLRWDDLGVNASVSTNNEVGTIAPTPIVSYVEADYKDFDNARRKVQYFAEYVGSRFQPNATTDPTKAITYATFGDYGNDDATRDTEVYDNDFYYWPYVDGFPGYASWSTTPNADGADQAGVNANDDGVNEGYLYAPFYMDLTATVIPAAMWGPATERDGQDGVDEVTSPLIEGGVDIDGGAPWIQLVGDASSVTPPDDNTVGSHTSVASYLTFAQGVDAPEACAPVHAVLLTDDDPASGGAPLYTNLSRLRTVLGVKTYVVGLNLDTTVLHRMACAGAGACAGACADPCSDTPTDNWDTCADDGAAQATGCGYVATSSETLEAALSDIINEALEIEIPSGPTSTVTDFGLGNQGEPGTGEPLQTKLSSYTDWPGWDGHVVRELCTDVDGVGDPLPQCVLPVPEFTPDEVEEPFGPCVQSRVWDAGECLKQTTWNDRRIYSHMADNTVYRITEPDGTASATFVGQLTGLGVIAMPGLQAKADAIAAFILGESAPGEWKLPGVANSVPVLVRRIPPERTERLPEIAISDPPCSGRQFGPVLQGALPNELEQFSDEAWNDADNPDAILDLPSTHYNYQQALLVGDDMGMLHAFQYDSGNELFGFIPRTLLATAAAQAANGNNYHGQPIGLDGHTFGIASTVNQGFVYDDVATKYRHLVVFGFGAGGTDYVALDVSHMSPQTARGNGFPVEVLWTTEDPAIKPSYDIRLGETWTRPTLSYHVDAEQLTNNPTAFLIFGSGYPTGAGGPFEGRVLFQANALTGVYDTAANSEEFVGIAAPLHDVYETEYSPLVDVAIGSHCLSRYWGEAQEAYIVDPAGRLFRWDLGRDTDHEADSGLAAWRDTNLAQEVFTFRACQGAGATCVIDSVSGKGDPFVFGPAVTAADRIDDFAAGETAIGTVGIDQFLVGLISGSVNDDSLDHTSTEGADFHPSIYLLVDDHSVGDKRAGFTIPAGAPKSVAAATQGDSLTADASYFRVALSDIERTRIVTPYPGAAPLPADTRNFGRETRPTRAPRVNVSGVIDPNSDLVFEGIEVYRITFTVHEPGPGVCDTDFLDPGPPAVQYYDLGTTYEITFRVTADTATGFNFASGTTDPAPDFGAGFETGLTLESVTQLDDEQCPGGNCGPTPGSPSFKSCDNNVAPGDSALSFAVPVRASRVDSFTPIE